MTSNESFTKGIDEIGIVSVIKLPMWHSSNIVSRRSTICTSLAGWVADSFGSRLIYSLLPGKSAQAAMEFSMVASALKHSIEGDYNMVTISEVDKLFGGAGSGRIQR